MDNSVGNPVSTGPSRPRIVLITSIVTAVIVGVGISLLINFNHSRSDFKSRSLTGAIALTQEQLEKVVSDSQLEAYWAGPRVGYLYTLDASVKNQVVLRYIKANKDKTNIVSNSRVIATYKSPNAFANSVGAASKPENTGFRNPDGSVVFYATAKKTDVYLAFPKKKVQIEIYDPIVGQALSLAILQDQITKVGQ